MQENFRLLRAQQLDRTVQPLRALNLLRPPKGWIRAFREAMGLPYAELGGRLHANRSLVVQQEKSEAEDRITLRSVRACADALDCDLVYAFVPRGGSIEATLRNRARDTASQMVRRVEHSMALEDQASDDIDQAIEAQTRRVRQKRSKR